MNALELRNMSAVEVLIAPTAYETRDALIKCSKTLTAIDDNLDYQMAVDYLRHIKALKSGVESSRVAVKSPVLDVGRKIDSLAKDFNAPIDPEENRIKGLVLGHERKQREIAEAAERQRQAELQAIENARMESEREARAKAEAAQAAARTEQERIAAAARANAELKRLADQAIEKQIEVAATVVTPSRPTGVTSSLAWKFRVTNLDDLYKSHPEMVELTVRTQVVNNAIRAGMRACPGISIFQEEVVRI